MRVWFSLECSECGNRNYRTVRDPKTEKLDLRKYCPFCRGHRTHKEKKK